MIHIPKRTTPSTKLYTYNNLFPKRYIRPRKA
jgi:hypothetical protein